MTDLNKNDPADLLFGSPESLADYLGVSIATVKRWQSGASMPESVRRLLVLRLGDLSGLLGQDWEGFSFGKDGKLYPPFFHGGFTALQIAGMFFEMQELRHLRRENKRLATDLKAAQEKAASLWAAAKVRELIDIRLCDGRF